MMNRKQSLLLLRKRFSDDGILRIIAFLQTLDEWVARLQELKRIPYESKIDIEEAFPTRIFGQLDVISPKGVDDETYYALKELLKGETTKLINTIIRLSAVRLQDFDLLQFNLYQIFGKEELASMVEWARVRLQEEIQRRKEEVGKEELAKKRKEQAYLRSLFALPQSALNKLAIANMFDFTPSARTDEERRQAIGKNRQTIQSHRLTFHQFEERLFDATENARNQSQKNVFQRMGGVQRYMAVVEARFRKKAAEFVSTEGPRKWIGLAGERIATQSAKFRYQMEKAGKDWRKDFEVDVGSARHRISLQSTKLQGDVAKKGMQWHQDFQKEIQEAQDIIGVKQKDLAEDRENRQKKISAHGREQFDHASISMAKGAADFADEVVIARRKFSGKEVTLQEKREGMGVAREVFQSKRDIAEDKFSSRGREIEATMVGSIYHERRRFEFERDDARQKFLHRAVEIRGTATAHVTSKGEKFLQDRTLAQSRFSTKASNIRGGSRSSIAPGAQGRVITAHEAVLAQGDLRRSAMQQAMRQQRDLFQYDVRFAQHRIHENAKSFQEKSAAKQEEFVSRGKQLVARHKARQKAHLIRNLLRTVRTMK